MMHLMDEGFFDVGSVESFRPGKGTVVRVDHVDVAVFNLDQGWYAIKDACPHMGASLADGRLEKDRIVCRWHDWGFDLATGEGDSQRRACVRVYELKLSDGRVWLKPPTGSDPNLSDKDGEAEDKDDDWMRADPDSWFR